MSARRNRNPALALRLDAWRARFVLGLILLAFVGLAARAVYLQGWQNDFLQARGDERYSRVIEMPASRGNLSDRNGSPLAVSTPTESIWVVPDAVPVDRATQTQLANALGISTKELTTRLADRRRNFVYLKRQIPPDQAEKVMALKIPGVFQQREYKRFYPQGEVMAHVVGFTGVDDRGQEGIELAHDQRLAGRAGSRRVIKDRRGRIVEDVGNVRLPRDGESVVLSVDQRVQAIAHDALRQAIDAHRAKGGAAVVLDARTGEVLALSNQPDYNPNNRARVAGAQTRNRTVTDLFEPGSTIKPFSLAAALEAGIVTRDSRVDTGAGLWQVGNAAISDTSPHGLLSVAEVLQKSSNIGTAKVALRLPPERLWNLYRDVGLGATPQTGFPGEAAGKLRPHDRWRPIEHATMSYGYGLSVSLLQLARAYTVWTNGGVLLPVSLTRREVDGNTRAAAGRRVVSPETAATIAHMLEMAAAAGGTAPKAQIPGYRIAGKTGTARKHIAGDGYADDKHVVSFVGYAPARDPHFIVAVMIDEPSLGKPSGGEMAAPVFARIMARTLALMAVPPDAASGNLQAQRPIRGQAG
jgi:cell division protein FtsI (penicillin-binding protein 3)